MILYLMLTWSSESLPHVITTLKWILKGLNHSTGHIWIAMWHQLQHAACGLQSRILLFGHCSYGQSAIKWDFLKPYQKKKKSKTLKILVFRGKVQGPPLQASKLNAVVYALLLFHNCRKTIKNGKKQMPEACCADIISKWLFCTMRINCTTVTQRKCTISYADMKQNRHDIAFFVLKTCMFPSQT